MLAIISLLLIVALSLIVTRTAAVALTYTGLSQQAASFQARSAFTGVGYTTSEAESLVNHPVRRQVVMLLMLLGNAGGDWGLGRVAVASGNSGFVHQSSSNGGDTRITASGRDDKRPMKARAAGCEG